MGSIPAVLVLSAAGSSAVPDDPLPAELLAKNLASVLSWEHNLKVRCPNGLRIAVLVPLGPAAGERGKMLVGALEAGGLQAQGLNSSAAVVEVASGQVEKRLEALSACILFLTPGLEANLLRVAVVRTSDKPVVEKVEDARARRIAGRDPEYPKIAQTAGIEGTVIVKVRIGPAGLIEEQTFLKSSEYFESEVVDALRSWRFKPRIGDGRSTSTITVFRFEFRRAGGRTK